MTPKDTFMLFCLWLYTACVFLLDFHIPRGFSIGIFYCIPIYFTLYIERYRHTIILAIFSTFLIWLGFIYALNSSAPPWITVGNRLISTGAVWLTAVAVARRKETEKLLKARIEQQRKIADFGRRALAGIPLMAIMEEANLLLADHFDVKSKILKYDHKRRETEFLCGAGWKHEMLGLRESVEGNTMSAYTLRSNKPLIVRNLQNEKRFRPPQVLLDEKIRSCINVTIPGVVLPFGILEADTSRWNYFHEEDVFILQSIANLLGDIIRRVEVEEELTEKTKQLQESNSELEQFAGIVSHDLKAPIRHMIGFSDLLEKKLDECEDYEAKELLEKIQFSAIHMERLVNAVLEYAKISQVRELSDVDLNIVAQQVIDDFKPEIHQRKARVELSELPSVLGNATLLHQLFQNLIGNALKYSSPDRPPVVRIEGKSNVEKIVCISDNGLGFKKEYASKIFEPFRRLHRKEEGTGLGLAICKKIVEIHGGRISADSEPGKGTTFTIIFPSVN